MGTTSNSDRRNTKLLSGIKQAPIFLALCKSDIGVSHHAKGDFP